MRRKLQTIITISLLSSIFGVYPVFAQVRVTIPSFPSCTKPQGSVVVTYKNGIHGIPGDTATYTGSDTVYNLSEDTLTQCFCSENSDGVQTNWWRISSLNEDEIAYLKALGWIYIPNGAKWGLEEAPYMAQNTQFGCSSSNNTSHHHNDDHENERSKSHTGGIGEVLAAGTSGISEQILGLASTGNVVQIVLVITFAVLALMTAVVLMKKRNVQ